jgi:prepilin-type N-terminal cleavage/methylation domain-containing protein
MLTVKKQSGFTLVEIAIVLVIIGLLLGGILKGQELITSARVRNLADQNSGIQAAYYGFIDRYRQIPGDMPTATAQAAIGNVVTAGIGGDGNSQLNDGSFAEVSALWHHLATAGFIAGNYPGGAADAATYQGTDANGVLFAPQNAFLGSVLLGQTDEYQGVGAGTLRLGYVFGNQIPVNVMRELDVKVDDSNPLTGVMRASTTAGVGAANYGGVETEGSGGVCTVVSGAATIWNISGNAQNCNAIYIY